MYIFDRTANKILRKLAAIKKKVTLKHERNKR